MPVACFRPDRGGIAWLPVYETYDPAEGQVLRVGRPPRRRAVDGPRFSGSSRADVKDDTGATVPLYEHREEGATPGSKPSR